MSGLIEEHFIDHTDDVIIIEPSEDSNQSSSSRNDSCFVAVHIGAGYHSQNKTPAYRDLCENICKEIMKLLKKQIPAREAVTEAVALLENSPLTNAGVGSNLTLDEKVECDASIMDQDGFGSVGAISNIKNPIKASLSLLEAQSKGTLSMGRIVPCMLVGEGAKLWAIDNNLEEVDDDFHKTEIMVKTNKYYKQKLLELNDIQKKQNTNMFDRDKQSATDENQCLDTVGAICLDSKGNLASAVSSGGILLKHRGRVGQASMYGCGCWVDSQETPENNEMNSIAICTTGCGEYIIKTLFAKECADHILRNNSDTHYSMDEFFNKKFFNSPRLKKHNDKLIGAMICKLETSDETEKSLELIVAHTTPSMGFGYMSSNMKKPKSVMSRLDANATAETLQVTNFHFDLSISNSKRKSVDLVSELDDAPKRFRQN